MKIHVAGENALIIYFGEETSPTISARVQQTAQRLPGLLGDGLIDLVPSYASLLVLFNPLLTDHLAVRQAIHSAAGDDNDAVVGEGRLVELPVYYSEESGPDLAALADRAQMSVQEVIDLHQGDEYRVYAIGFAPGFAYLGQVNERIAAPRLSTPRQKVPKGAVAIADQQTAVYPAVSPGGWNLIGLCPTPMFDPQAEPTMPVTVGDRVRFKSIEREEFLALGGELPEGGIE
ncbi:5-oxoprolinase subunit PxpB [Pseudomaricurvus alkylphenolicus]|jgi:KipI family sensor histidine kinase inhibitor|uniref:5-oxoprolinase subunit PxpB n=1 Tax=Pseudomaricurvus alkylphenolicus TaxID=1306991 RepID=UPI001421C184|nr:5-oxoprolinase subunit PxpB [Pseudomaricurvus alkylphenolicus]NIB42743.1 5-oxoprolinase subunit PxpB [Pseudomaricurvus alkylphenolicus]